MSQSAISTHFLNTSRDGDSTTSLVSLFQCLSNGVVCGQLVTLRVQAKSN